MTSSTRQCNSLPETDDELYRSRIVTLLSPLFTSLSPDRVYESPGERPSCSTNAIGAGAGIEVNTLKLAQPAVKYYGTQCCQDGGPPAPSSTRSWCGGPPIPVAQGRRHRPTGSGPRRRRALRVRGVEPEQAIHIAAHHFCHIGRGEQFAHFFGPVQRVGHALGMGVIGAEQDVLR
jgi:hypothetical protein